MFHPTSIQRFCSPRHFLVCVRALRFASFSLICFASSSASSGHFGQLKIIDGMCLSGNWSSCNRIVLKIARVISKKLIILRKFRGFLRNDSLLGEPKSTKSIAGIPICWWSTFTRRCFPPQTRKIIAMSTSVIVLRPTNATHSPSLNVGYLRAHRISIGMEFKRAGISGMLFRLQCLNRKQSKKKMLSTRIMNSLAVFRLIQFDVGLVCRGCRQTERKGNIFTGMVQVEGFNYLCVSYFFLISILLVCFLHFFSSRFVSNFIHFVRLLIAAFSSKSERV